MYPTVTVTRVVVNKQMDAVPPNEAARIGIFPDVIFIRDDNWVLGAPRHLAARAERLYQGSWVMRINLPGRHALTNEELEQVAKGIVDDMERSESRRFQYTSNDFPRS